MPKKQPVPIKIKFLFWSILGAFSIFFAELFSGSDMFPFLHFWGLFVELPLYTLHLLILAYVVFNFGKPLFPSLYLAGTIFGMYEAYLTKVLWNPPWGDALITIGGVGIIETIVLVIFWHPFLAFIIPLIACSYLLNQFSEMVAGMPLCIRKIMSAKKSGTLFVLINAAFFGTFQSTNAPSAWFSLLSCPLSAMVLVILVCLWKRTIKDCNYNFLEILPNRVQFVVLIALLIIMYIIMGRFIRPEALPDLSSQLTVWLIYGVLLIAFILSLKRSRKIDMAAKGLKIVRPSFRIILCAIIVFTFCSTIGRLFLSNWRAPILLSSWFIFSVFGMSAFLFSLKHTLVNPKTSKKL